MNSFEEQIAIYNDWSNEYCSKVIAEYERFIILRSNNFNIFPSDDIKDIWHFHILNTEMYSKFCLEKFGKMIHYNPMEMLNIEMVNYSSRFEQLGYCPRQHIQLY